MFHGDPQVKSPGSHQSEQPATSERLRLNVGWETSRASTSTDELPRPLAEDGEKVPFQITIPRTKKEN